MLPSPEQYLEMLDGAAAGRYAFPAINVTSSQTLNAAMRGFAEAESDGIVQVTVGGARYLSGVADEGLAGARALAALGRELAGRYPVAIALHTDHCPPEHVASFLRPLLTASREQVERGHRPLFHSHMFDGSTLPLHGLYAPGRVGLRPQILAEGQEALEVAHSGARFQYVFHGSSGSSPEELRAAMDNGVVKVNLDSETQYAFTRAAAEHMIDHRDGVVAAEPASGDKRAYDPRAWGCQGRDGHGGASGAGLRAARLGGTEHRRVIRRPEPCPARAWAMGPGRSRRGRRVPAGTRRSG
jgi:fructose/tagatose bisphosphate aldolase